jgi:hypothetical protein
VPRRLFNLLSASSLILCLVALGLWAESHRWKKGVQFDAFEGQYSLRCYRGQLALWSPPAPTRSADEARARAFAERLRNDRVSWSFFRPPPGAVLCGNGPSRYLLPIPHQAESDDGLHGVAFPDAQEPLLEAMRDTDRFAAAHGYLAFLYGPAIGSHSYDADVREERGKVIGCVEGLIVELSAEGARTTTDEYVHTVYPAWRADPAQRATLRSVWHRRLNREALSIPIWWLVAATSVLPLAWAVKRHREIAAYRPGHCAGCGYDLRASPLRCPECGATGSGS